MQPSEQHLKLLHLRMRTPKTSSDSTTINVVQAVTYGSTFGAITAGNDPDVGAPAADAVIFKQATKQGAIEGALMGCLPRKRILIPMTYVSRASIVAAASTNAQAAADASSSMASDTYEHFRYAHADEKIQH